MRQRNFWGSVVTCIIAILLLTGVTSADTGQVISLKVGSSISIYASMQKEDSIQRAELIGYEVLDKSIASVSDDGYVKALSPGKTYVEISAVLEGSVVHESILLNVYTDVLNFEIDINSIVLDTGTLYKVPYALKTSPGSLSDEPWINWSSSDKSVATVDNQGNVSVHGKGKSVITGITQDGLFTDSMSIVALESDSKIIVNNGFAKVMKVGEIFTPSVYSRDVDIDTALLEIQSLTPEKIIVNTDGSLKALDAGEGKVLYIDHKNHLSTVLDTRNVSQVSDIEFEEDMLSFSTLGEMQQVHYDLIPYTQNDAIYEKGVVWGATDNKIAKVEEGLVTAVGYGATQILARTVDGNHIAKLWVYVKEEPEIVYDTDFESIDLIPVKYETYVGEAIKLNISTKPDFISFNQIKVTVLRGPNSQIELREDGYYFVPSETARNVIYVRTPDGHVDHQAIYAKSKISRIIIPDDMIQVSKEGHDAMYVGQEVQLKYQLKPSGDLTLQDVEDSEVIWSTSDSSIVEIVDGEKLHAHKIGEAVITVKTVDGGSEDEITVGVYPTTFSFTLVPRAERQVGDIYKPEAAYSTIYAFDEPIIDEFEITVTGTAMTEADVLNEIDYYSKRAEYVKAIGQGTSVEYYKYQQQVKLYSEILKNKQDGYCKIPSEIAVQLFVEEPFVKIVGSNIELLRTGKIDFIAKSLDNELVRSFSLLVTDSGTDEVLSIEVDGLSFDMRREE